MAKPPKGRGWADVGYHGVIEYDGGFFQGRPDNTLGAHVAGHNDGNLGICLVGESKFTEQQFAALGWWIENKMRAYGISVEKVFCHYEWDTGNAQGKTCPNLHAAIIREWIALRDDSLIEPYVLR